MNIEHYITFVSSLIKRLHVPCHIIENPSEFMSSEIDGGLRATLFGVTNYSELLLNSPSEAQDNMVYVFFDEYQCRYIFFKIPERNDSYFYIGPYISSLPTEEFIYKKVSQLSLNDTKFDQLKTYYRNLPIIEDENILLSIVDTLATYIWDGANNYNIEYVPYEIPDKRQPIYSSGVFENIETNESNLTLEMIESNYKNEKLLIEAVSKGKFNKVNMITSTLLNFGTEDRLPDSLRNRKNYLIILNTLLRKSAEYGEVHPYHIHRLSSLFAKKIEELYSIESSFVLQKDMILKYCLLVKEHSLKKYSQLIGRVITLISYDLSAPLTLKYISSIMNVNASYLSTTFKKECGETLTDYINRKRMEHAANILAHTDKQVQTIAAECGILDVNYFIKIFKKYYGLTPTQYRKIAMP